MIAQAQIDPTILSQLIDRLPPGRARKRYEDMLTQISTAVPLGGVLCKGHSTDEPGRVAVELDIPRLTIIVKESRKVVPPIRIQPWITVLDPDRFIDATLGDLAAYVAAKNHGKRHWVENLLEEKLEQLELCGITAEIVIVQ